MKITYTEAWSIDLNAVDPNMVQMVEEGVEGTTFIMNNPDNLYWKEYQDWLAKGNKPIPVTPQPQPQPAIDLYAKIAAMEKEIEELKRNS
jgi:hypothetical protein